MDKTEILVNNFLKKILIGHNTDTKNSDDVVKKCISLAYKDMLDAGKYYLDFNLGKANSEKTKNNESRKDDFYKLLCAANFEFSKELIENTCAILGTEEQLRNTNNFATRFGLSQKLVNMTFKYFYVFRKEIDIDIDFSRCDCPLDSIIQNKLEEDFTWSKLDKAKYDEIQSKIDSKHAKSSYKINLVPRTAKHYTSRASYG